MIEDGRSFYGGGIRNEQDASLYISNSTIRENAASFAGGGIYNAGELRLTNTTLSDNIVSYNSAGGSFLARGGGLFSTFNSSTELVNTTVAGNVVEITGTTSGSSVRGGGIYSYSGLTIENSTITGNWLSVVEGQNNMAIDGGVAHPGDLIVTNSIIAGNAYRDVSYGADLRGGNILEDGSGQVNIYDGTTLTGTTTIDRVFAETEEVLDVAGGSTGTFAGVLADNGGAVETVALLRGGDAIDVGDATLLSDPKDTDARGAGFLRVVGPQGDGTELDLGAYEEQIPDQAAFATFDNFLRINEDGSTITGAIAIEDPDPGDDPSFANALGTALDDDIGDLSVNTAGDELIFELDAQTVQALESGEVANVRYRVEADDGTQATVTINVRGADDGTNQSETLNGSFIGDFIDGLRGVDTINGFGGDDTLVGGTAGDRLNGGGGSDTASFQGSSIRNVADLQGLVAGVGDAAGDVYNSIENLEGGNFIDVLFGDQEDNVVSGGRGSDRVAGRAGDDTLDGGVGFDKLYGNRGVDVMTGGGGNDRFIYFQITESGVGAGNRDIITDFNAGDRIEISRFDADETTGGNQAFQFISTSQFSDAGQVRFFQAASQGITVILANTDDDAAAEFQIELQGLVDLEASNFLL